MKNFKIILYLLIFVLVFSILYSKTLPEYDTQEYIIGKGDILRIRFIEPNYPEQIVTVNYEGYISSVLIRRINVEGQTLSEAKKNIHNQLSSRFVNLKLDLQIFLSRKIEETKFYNEFKSKIMLAEKYFLDLEYETTLFALHDAVALILERLKRIYPEKYGEKVLFLQFRNVNFNIEGAAPFKLYNIQGEIINHTERTFQWVKIRVDFLNSEKRIINSIERYGISDKPIKPMESREFIFRGSLSREAVDVKYEIIEFQVIE